MAGSLTKGVLCFKQYLLDQNSEGSSTVMIQTWPGRKVKFQKKNQHQVQSCYSKDIPWPRGDTKTRVKYFIFQHEKRNFLSPSGQVMFYLLYQHQ